MDHPRLPFGGKNVVFGGDFRQVLPVVPKGTRAQIVAASLRKSYLWESMIHLKLVRNMRAQSDPWFVRNICCASGLVPRSEIVNLRCVFVMMSVCHILGATTTFSQCLTKIYQIQATSLQERYCPHRMTGRYDKYEDDWLFLGEQLVYHSYYTPEFLNTLTPNGLPPHVLKLKIGCPVILLRNIDPANGLCMARGWWSVASNETASTQKLF
ncbi:hypothetical protein U9M48_023354 [Paspalum notatum var. saurae]|uniref:ATP-dependent DNA helicase n=1 Tax=Paspalum notatum var. saurae TaxID=547442 RepID=A0AAQ3WV17_PASNO